MGEKPTDRAIADATGLTTKQVTSAKHHVWKARVDSLDRPVGGFESTIPLGETIMCRDDGPDADLDQAELLGFLRDGLALLPERHRLVLVGCFFEGRSVTDVGLLLGVTQSRASQLKNEAIEMLRIGLEFQFAEKADDECGGRQRQFNQDLAERTSWRERAAWTEQAGISGAA